MTKIKGSRTKSTSPDQVNILVVDDEVHLCDAVHRILSRHGYRVRTATDGHTALELLREKAPDVLLLDIVMPGIGGREILQKVREAAPATRIIYFTARAEVAGSRGLKDLRREADAFIAKPVTAKRIVDKVRNVLASYPAVAGADTASGAADQPRH